MSHLVFHRQPNLHGSTLVAAFSGWPDAQEAASRSLRYLIRKLSAQKFAEVEPEEFYVFSRVRPRVRLDREGTRRLRWPSNTFYSWHDESSSRDMVFLVGAEPNLKWNTYSRAIMEVAHTCDVARMVVLGSLLDATPHTREPGITGLATDAEVRELFAELGVTDSRYQGPTGLPSVLMEACVEQGLSYASMWVHSPHYLQASPNPKASYTLLKRLLQVLDLDVDLSDLSDASQAFEDQVSRALAQNPEWQSHFRKLEERYDRATGHVPEGPQEELPAPDVVIKDLEEFLQQQQRNRRSEGPAAPPSGEEPEA